ncbi:eCIS core domain-containing protein [Desulfacinum infernum]|uniref:eCIS core domain-containing protein n=1 Tax=Desulfacinum infernum TaxID=35837 RepID=UPI0015B722D6|nr:DUF4157 domain-containing protein [Desulfacinum infernum]
MLDRKAARGAPSPILQRSPDNGAETVPAFPRLTLGTSPFFHAPGLAPRLSLGLPPLELRLDPEIERQIQQILETRLDPLVLQNQLQEAAARVETAPWLPSPTRERPAEATRERPPAPGPSPLREGSLGDVARALAATEPVAGMLRNLQDQARDFALGVWGRATPGERGLIVTSSVVVGGGALAGVLASPSARDRVLPLLNGRPLPIPGVDWLHVEIYTDENSVMFGAHLDVGALLPPEWGFGPGSPRAIGGPPSPEPFPPLQRKEESPGASGQPVPWVAPHLERARGSGRLLDPDVRTRMEHELGADLSAVRVHENAASDGLSRSLRAKAFTWGTDIFFRQGAYNPRSIEGRRLIAHELVHTLQQEQGLTPALPQGKGPVFSAREDPLEAQADRIAHSLDLDGMAPLSFRKFPVPKDRHGPLHASRTNGIRRDTGSRRARDPRTDIPRVDAEEILSRDFSHLVSVLSPEQVRQIQAVLDAKRELERLDRLMEPLRGSILSVDVRRRERLMERAQRHSDIVRENRFLQVPTDRVLADDVVTAEREDPPEIHLFKQRLYRQLIVHPMILAIPDGYPPRPLLLYQWGPGGWRIPHRNGQVRFEDLMTIQRFNLDYQRVLLHGMAETLEEMLELRRRMGGMIYDARGRVVGEIDGWMWNTTVRVGWEIGRLTGYYNDGRGRHEMLGDLFRLRGARIVLRAPDNWLHIYSLDPPIHLRDLTSPGDDGYGYILRRGTQVNVHQIITSDGAWLEETPAGWRHEEYSTGLNVVEEFAVGAIFGDWYREPSTAATIGQILIGCIPIVGQIADARDVAAGIYRMWETGGSDGKLQTVLALVGFVPLLGDAIRSAGRAGGRRAAAEAFERAAPDIQNRLSRELLRDADDVARRFPGLSRAQVAEQVAENAALLRRVTEEGGEAVQEYAARVARQLDEMGGNAGAVIHLHGGAWQDVARALARAGDQGTEIMNRMQAWRIRQFDRLGQEVDSAYREMGMGFTGRTLGPPQMQRTGTNAMTSDVDISFLGRDATFYRNYAVSVMERRYGPGWKRLLDADIFADPRRLHLFTELPGRAAREVEQRMVRETEVNTLARMLREGTPRETVERYARDAEVPMERVTERLAELERLASDPTLRRRLELQMDDLHRQFELETNPARKAALAEEMARLQSRINAAIEGPYVSPGGAARHVTRRENIGRIRSGAFTPLSPAMNYMSVLDDLAMISHVATEAAREGFRASTAKGLMKYCDRLLVAAGANGVDLTRIHSARTLYEDTWQILDAARRDPLGAADRVGPLVRRAQGQLDEAIDDLIRATRTNAQRYLATPVPGVTRQAVLDTVERSVRTLHSHKANLARATSIAFRRHMVMEQEETAEPERRGLSE